MTGTPYDTLGNDAFWRSAVVAGEGRLWTAKFAIDPRAPIATAGSCFAQHLSRALVARGFNWLDAEPAPAILPPSQHAAFNYGVFSFRTGNIYTPALLAQWFKWAVTRKPLIEAAPAEGGGFRDLMRPNIEPSPFISERELQASFNHTLVTIGQGMRLLDTFVFTLGLTEAWRNRRTGVVYPMCPGTIAGTFNPDDHEFVNYDYQQTRAAMDRALRFLWSVNPQAKVLLTVSPVPLTATASGDHVLPATIYSKSVLRAVAGDLAKAHDQVDYFPSYEIISAFPSRGAYYEDNLRSVKPAGVERVMQTFFAGLSDEPVEATPRTRAAVSDVPLGAQPLTEAEVCEDLLLELRQRG